MKRRYTGDGKGYYLGLDMGTSSVGWAVTDDNYQLLRVKGKDLWGIREFDEAQTAEERRMHRVSRRRRQRERVRIGLVKSMFHDALAEKDPDFLQRLENSKYHIEDKDEQVRYKYGIFNDKNYTDADYYSQYPTIYHLRQELINNPEEHDVRLVFLAVLNIFKHRGHFLNAGLTGISRPMAEVYLEFAEAVNSYLEDIEADSSQCFDLTVDEKALDQILGDRSISRTEKAEGLQELFGIDKKNKEKLAYLKLICGLSVDLKVLFPGLETEEALKLSFSDYNYDEKIIEIEDHIEERQMDIILAAKAIYDTGAITAIMHGFTYLSDARVADYNKHKDDLATLKKTVRKYAPDKYAELFKATGDGSYSAYINSSNSKGNKNRRNMKSRKKEDLYKTIKRVLKSAPENDKAVAYIFREINTETFLPKQLTASNGIIPNQVHKAELEKILENAAAYLPFLLEEDENGLTVKNRLIQLFSFQIPYYVGPVTEASERNGGNGWVVRKRDGAVLPWTLEETVDLTKTREAFIERLIRQCTYIAGEKVLPKSSLKYERYAVLNEINNIRIDGEKISVALKQAIYKDLFEPGRRVSRKRLFSYLKARGLVEEESQITGIDKQINNSLASYGKFAAIFGDRIREDRFKEIAEDVIFWCTVYSDDRKFILRSLTDKYGSVLTEAEIRKISGFKFRDWGRLSAEFLDLQGCYKPTGEVVSLSAALWSDENNCNMMELLHSDKYTFGEELQKKQGKELHTLNEFTHEDLNEMYFSAPVKRMIWQTLLVIRELTQILGEEPARVFIEMTRTDETKGDAGRKDSRRKQLESLYKKISSETPAWKKEMLSRIEEADSSGKLRSKKLYLYFTQMGRCMYTGQPIELADLFNDNIYDIDHIYPRHYVKDDNINNNLVLVYKPKNAHKSDVYPIEAEIRKAPEVRGLWERLLKNGLITEEKFRRLTGSAPFTDEQLAGFIARQMVETRQGTKGVADLLRQLLPEQTEIVYAKAGNVSDFRRDYNLLKCRSVNDFHHAHDAYLNIVIGNAYFVKFTRDPRNFIKEYRKDQGKYSYHLDKMFSRDIRRGVETAWIAPQKNGEPGTIATVKKTLARNTPLLTRMSFVGHGKIADATLWGAKKANDSAYIPLKTSDPKIKNVKKYGGYSSVRTACFFLVEHGQDNQRTRTIETLPVYLFDKIQQHESLLEDYCETVLGLVNPSVRIPIIRMQSLIKRNGFPMHLSGKTGNQIELRNAVNLCLKQYWINYIHEIEKCLKKGFVSERITKENNEKLYQVLLDKHLNGIYQRKPATMGNKLLNGYPLFSQMDMENQISLLSQIIAQSRIGLTSSDLTKIGGSANSGKIKISKNLSGRESVQLVYQSVTGVYEKEIDLLTV